MSGVGYSLQTSSEARGASEAAFDSSGWNVSYGSGGVSTASNSVPSWLLIAGAALAAYWLLRRRR